MPKSVGESGFRLFAEIAAIGKHPALSGVIAGGGSLSRDGPALRSGEKRMSFEIWPELTRGDAEFADSGRRAC